VNRSVIHCDNDNFFATVEEKHNPLLKSLPFAVCGDPEMRHSIVMAKNSLAKKAGVPTGISFRQATQICPDLRYIRANFPAYLAEAKAARDIYMKYTDTIKPYGMDESWVELTPGTPIDTARQIAEAIRVEIMYSRQLSASIGVSYNYIFSKIGSDMNKPNAVTVITKENYKEKIWPLSSGNLLFVGAQRKKLLASVGITTIGDIARAEPLFMGKLLGKAGVDLWQFANGNDRNFDPACDDIGSIGNTITPPEDLRNNDEVSAVIYMITTAICARLKKHKLKAGCISISMRDSNFDKTIRQCRLKCDSDNVNYLFNHAFKLFKRHYKWETYLRSIGVRVDNLTDLEQLSLIKLDECDIIVDIDSRIKKLTDRFGVLSVEKSATTRDW
jgi:DNA polymerase-4